MITGMPEPPLLGFLLNKTPHVIGFCCFDLGHLHEHLAGIEALKGCGIDVLEVRRLFCVLQ